MSIPSSCSSPPSLPNLPPLLDCLQADTTYPAEGFKGSFSQTWKLSSNIDKLKSKKRTSHHFISLGAHIRYGTARQGTVPAEQLQVCLHVIPSTRRSRTASRCGIRPFTRAGTSEIVLLVSNSFNLGGLHTFHMLGIGEC